MVHCCVPYCKSKKGKVKGLSFHEFPSNEELRAKWLKAVSRKNFDINSDSGSSVVCGNHFKPSDYGQTFKVKRLKPDAVPSIFKGYPTYMKKVSPKKRTHNKIEITHQLTQSPYPIPIPDTNLISNTPSQLDDVITENIAKIHELERKVKRLHTKIWKNNCMLQDLQEKYDKTREEVTEMKHNVLFASIEKIEKDAITKPEAQFLYDCILNYGKNHSKWTESSIRECILFQHISPRGYVHAKSRLLKLPCKNTLKKYTGSLVTEDGVNSLVKERLALELSSLSDEEIFSSLIIDEMAIQPKCIYDKGSDTIFGFTAGEEKKVLANRLLCFVINGLSTNYSIPCAYYFTKNLSGKKLYNLTCEVIKQVESCGFVIVRVVTDNHKSNVLLFKNLSKNNTLRHKVQHPNDINRFLFLSFDPCHIIKNIRSQFLEKEMSGKESYITGNYVKKVYELQKDQVVKPVRFLTRKHVYPNNLEKMNVMRAVQIFSAPVIATLQFFRENSFAHPQGHFFRDAGDTICFMSNVKKWFDIHDVGNRTLGFHSRNANKEHFFSMTDERLDWLETEFPSYLEEIKKESEECEKDFLTPETYSALLLTSLSTVACVKYLLENGFHYVLTRRLSSDPVESLFSAVRQMNGGNDASDAKASTVAINKILRTGLLLPHHSSNVPGKHLSSGCLLVKKTQEADSTVVTEIPEEGMAILKKLDSYNGYVPVTMSTASLAYVGGYLVKVLEKETSCIDCIQEMSVASCASPLLRLIRNQDQGSLKYPSKSLIYILCVIQEFSEYCFKYAPNKGVYKVIMEIAIEKLDKVFVKLCSKPDHSKMLAKLVCEKFIKAVIENIARKHSDKFENIRKLNVKPINRKLLKFS